VGPYGGKYKQFNCLRKDKAIVTPLERLAAGQKVIPLWRALLA